MTPMTRGEHDAQRAMVVASLALTSETERHAVYARRRRCPTCGHRLTRGHCTNVACPAPPVPPPDAATATAERTA